MKLKNRLSIQRLVAKIENDFNLGESDWIPRVAAWTIDALSQMKVLPMERKRRTLTVEDKVARFPCELNAEEIKVFDSNGIEISELNKSNSCCSSRGVTVSSNSDIVVGVTDPSNRTGVNSVRVATITDPCGSNRNFVIDCNNIELNFDTDTIDVETFEVATYHDDYFDCEVPYIYDDGLLLEALAWYCLFKYLSRGSHHPVYDLKSPNSVVNPYVQWNTLRPKAAASVKAKLASDGTGWANFFYNFTFMPRG